MSFPGDIRKGKIARVRLLNVDIDLGNGMQIQPFKSQIGLEKAQSGQDVDLVNMPDVTGKKYLNLDKFTKAMPPARKAYDKELYDYYFDPSDPERKCKNLIWLDRWREAQSSPPKVEPDTLETSLLNLTSGATRTSAGKMIGYTLAHANWRMPVACLANNANATPPSKEMGFMPSAQSSQPYRLFKKGKWGGKQFNVLDCCYPGDDEIFKKVEFQAFWEPDKILAHEKIGRKVKICLYFTSPNKLHTDIEKHVLDLPGSPLDHFQDKFWELRCGQDFIKEIEILRRNNPFQKAKGGQQCVFRNQNNPSPPSGNMRNDGFCYCPSDEHFCEVHDKVRELSKKYVDAAVAFFQGTYINKKEGNLSSLWVIPRLENIGPGWLELHFRGQINFEENVNGLIAFKGWCYDWETEVPTFHLAFFTFYHKARMNPDEHHVEAPQGKPWFRGELKEIK